MTFRDWYFFAAGLGAAATLVFVLWIYSEWRDYKKWLEESRRL